MNNLKNLYEYTDRIKSRLTTDELYELENILYNLENDFNEIEVLENELYKMENENQFLQSKYDDLLNAIEKAIYQSERLDGSKDDLIEEIEKLIEENEEKEYNKEVDNSEYEKMKNEVLSMVKQGYVFTSGEPAKVYKKYIKEQKIENEKVKIEKMKEQLGLRNAIVEPIGENLYNVACYDIDANVDMKTEKTKGKGSRSFKKDILERVRFFIDYGV